MTQISLDAARLREIRGLIDSGSSISFQSHRAHESIDGMQTALAAILELHPIIEAPTHGCCGGTKLCSGHAPECGGREHALSRPRYPCATLRAMGIQELELPECGATFHTGERSGYDHWLQQRNVLRERVGILQLVCTRRFGHNADHEMRKGKRTVATWYHDERNDRRPR